MGQFIYFKFPPLGLNSKKLIKSYTTDFGSGYSVYYSYELDEKGRIMKEVIDDKVSNKKIRIYEYCK